MTRSSINKKDLEKDLSYRFKKPILLEEALYHSSYVNEHPELNLQDNERFEFLGDAVLNLIISHMLIVQYPKVDEGVLSRMRASLVNEKRLASIARKLHLGKYIRLGKGEAQTNGQNKDSILADTFEALIAAVYLDSNFKKTVKIIDALFSQLLSTITSSLAKLDYKSKLQELLQSKGKKLPKYKVTQETGPDHNKTFCVKIVHEVLEAEGTGKSKKLAEQDAARKALEILKKAEGS